MKIALHTYGCKVNSYETEVIRQQIGRFEEQVPEENAEVHIINTCTVTKKIDKEILRKIKHLKKKGKKVILTGCLVERKDREARDILSFADEIIPNSKKLNIVMSVEASRKNCDNLILSDFFGRDRAFIKVEDGCDNYCSYCEVPYVRGDKIKSREIDDIKKEFENLSYREFNEIVLTGVNLGFYGREKGLKDGLYYLLSELIKLRSNARIRLSSIGPNEISNNTINLIANSNGKICPHIHLSLQSADQKILKLMNRNYSLQQYEDKMKKIVEKIPFAAITTDVIAGFPEETEEEFKNTYNFIKVSPFSRLHVFPFSKRPDTVASKMKKQVSETEKKQRVNELIKLGKLKEKEFAEKNTGLIRKVLVESDKKNGFQTGYTDNYIRVKFNSEDKLTGKLVDVKLLEYEDGFVWGKIV